MTSAAIPVLETERLRLRAHRVDDFEAARAMWADPAVVRYIGGKPSTPQQTWMRILAYAGHWSLLDFGYWAIADRASDAFLGEIGFADFKRDFAPSCAGIPELGWALTTEATGRGIATEAARAACTWGDARFEHDRTVCLIDARNVASLGVARKCAYATFDRTEHAGVETLLLARARREPG
jgi:RimJ/RimL family protein N-acetyltransferase